MITYKLFGFPKISKLNIYVFSPKNNTQNIGVTIEIIGFTIPWIPFG